MTGSGAIKMEFATQIHGDVCIEAIKEALSDSDSVEIDAIKGSVLIETTLPWLEIHKRIEATGRRAVLTGFGGQSGVAIIDHGNESTNVRGVVRFCTLANNSATTGAVVDGTIDGLLRNSRYHLNVHECGDISDGCNSIGDVYDSKEITSDESGRATIRLINEQLKVDDLIGRSVAITESEGKNRRLSCGIVARSAGIFQNYKKICACDGVTIWDERNKSIAAEKERAKPQSTL